MRTKFPTTFIYGLVDPFTAELRYVGKADDPCFRLKSHMIECPQGGSHRKYWLQSLKKQGVVPELAILEEVSVSDWQEAEMFWIGYFKAIGSNLTNSTKGGEGIIGLVHTEESKKKMAQNRPEPVFTKECRDKISAFHKNKPKSDSHRRKISEALKGKPKSEEHKKKCSQSGGHWLGRKHSEETKHKMSENNMGNKHPMYGRQHSEEAKAKISLSLLGNTRRAQL